MAPRTCHPRLLGKQGAAAKFRKWGIRHFACLLAHLLWNKNESVGGLLADCRARICGVIWAGSPFRLAGEPSRGGYCHLDCIHGWHGARWATLPEVQQQRVCVGKAYLLETGTARSLIWKDHRPRELGRGSETGTKCRL